MSIAELVVAKPEGDGERSGALVRSIIFESVSSSFELSSSRGGDCKGFARTLSDRGFSRRIRRVGFRFSGERFRSKSDSN